MENIPTATNPSIWPPKREIIITLILQVIIVGCAAFLSYNRGLVTGFKTQQTSCGVTIPPSLPTTPKESSMPVACTMDAKQCPDGSYVGRSGPKCEFAPCPVGTPLPIDAPPMLQR